MNKDKIDLPNLLKLAKLAVSEQEQQQLASELENAIDLVERINEVDTTGTLPFSPANTQNVHQTKTANDAIDCKGRQLLDLAKETVDDFYMTKLVVSNE